MYNLDVEHFVALIFWQFVTRRPLLLLMVLRR